MLEFGQGYERVEVIPAYAKSKVDGNVKFDIPGVVHEWLESTPEAHLDYVDECNKTPVKGAAKSLARLVKAWKYYRSVPVSSFYLEMRAAAYMADENYVNYPDDVYRLLKRLRDHELSAMNDLTGATGRIFACSTDANRRDALSKLDTAVTKAGKAIEAHKAGRKSEAFAQWNLVFNGKFPAYY